MTGLSPDIETLLRAFDEKKPIALSRLISAVENRPGESLPLLSVLHERTGHAHVIGITGPPGAGKSTLVNALIKSYRDAGQTVAVVAVDPSSPFSGGAILGDRIRMLTHYTDQGVFIRSLSTRGALGGLSRATRGVVTLFDAFGFDKVIVETVGVGQTEFQILGLAHTSVVVLVPEAGDSIQTQKAGLLEVADVFVVNKADRSGAHRMAGDLDESIHLSTERPWRIPVLLTKAREEDHFDGVPQLHEALDRHFHFLKEDGRGQRVFQHERTRQWKALALEELERRFDDIFEPMPAFQSMITDSAKSETNPYLLLETFLAALKKGLTDSKS